MSAALEITRTQYTASELRALSGRCSDGASGSAHTGSGDGSGGAAHALKRRSSMAWTGRPCATGCNRYKRSRHRRVEVASGARPGAELEPIAEG